MGQRWNASIAVLFLALVLLVLLVAASSIANLEVIRLAEGVAPKGNLYLNSNNVDVPEVSNRLHVGDESFGNLFNSVF